jgi:hypothetical protein
MARGKALHPRLVAAWSAFAEADQKLRRGIDVIQDKRRVEEIAEIERTEGRKARWHVQTLMMKAKATVRLSTAEPPEIAGINQALAELEDIVKATEAFAAANPDSKIGSSFVSSAKTLLVTAKLLMRRIRDKVPYSSGDRMMLEAGSGWMVEGSPPRLLRDYNQLIDSYNRGARF